MVKMWAVVKANFLTQWRYQVNFWLETLSIFVIIFPSLTLTFNGSNGIWGFSSGRQYSFYLLVALSIWGFVECLWSFVFQLRSEISVFSGYSLGVILMGLMLIWKECDQLVSFIGNIAPFICGMLVPLVNMPIGLRFLGLWMPFTWGLDIVRYLFFGYETLLPIYYEIGILIVLTVIYYILSKLIFDKLNRLSKKKGGIIGY